MRNSSVFLIYKKSVTLSPHIVDIYSYSYRLILNQKQQKDSHPGSPWMKYYQKRKCHINLEVNLHTLFEPVSIIQKKMSAGRNEREEVVSLNEDAVGLAATRCSAHQICLWTCVYRYRANYDWLHV